MCQGDDENAPVHTKRTTCGRLIDKLTAFAFLALALYTMYSLFTALQQISREDLQLSDKPPSDRCVKMFDSIVAFKNDQPENTAFAVYDYIAKKGEAVSRVCTNASKADVLAAVGTDYEYNPWVEDADCDPINNLNDRSLFSQNCELVNFGTDPNIYPNCIDLLDYEPTPYGLHWNHYLTKLSGNKTFPNGTVVPYPRCSMKVTKVEDDIANCTLPTMVPLHDRNKNIQLVLQLACAVPFIVMLLQAFCVYKYSSKGWKAEDGGMLAFAVRGIPGPIYQAYWEICIGDGDENHGEFPEVYLPFWAYLICLVSDLIEGVAAPITSILGCQLTRFPLSLGLLVLKCIKILYDTTMYLYHRKDDNEPGGRFEQANFWGEKQMEQNRKNASPQHTSATAV